MKLPWLFAVILASALVAHAAPVTYELAFIGGLNLNSGFVPFAPSGGSFTYDTTNGFSEFDVSFNGEIFDFTSSANTPSICPQPGQCTPGDASQTFAAFTSGQDIWTATGNSFFAPFHATLNLISGDVGVSSTAGPFISFDPTVPITGSFTATPAAVPEPSSAALLLGVALICAAALPIRRLKQAPR
ncbi:MAG TPA: hypothetical protein VGL97_12045 [Bryobacteraceae bacterium]|jgi:hypothetical protein